MTEAWLQARDRAANILDVYLMALRRSGNLVGTLATDGAASPYMRCLNALADAAAPAPVAPRETD